jgi:hypothetical protein
MIEEGDKNGTNCGQKVGKKTCSCNLIPSGTARNFNSLKRVAAVPLFFTLTFLRPMGKFMET